MKILIADDDLVSRRRLEGTLARMGNEVEVVPDGREAVAALLRPDGPRLAILDWMMPGADGPTVCRTLRERSPCYVYLVLLTGRDRREDMVAGLDAGADDFLTKPFDAVELRARLQAGARVLALQEGLLAAQEALRVQATHDHLTGLWNRGMILDQLSRELRRAEREKSRLALVIADVDHFKEVNDTRGHAAGDAVLRQTAERMRAALRSYDCLGRYGGEEFLLLLPGQGPSAARQVAERVRARVAGEPMTAGGVALTITLSLGLALSGGGELEPAGLIKRADEALYRAKAGGRNRVEEAGSA